MKDKLMELADRLDVLAEAVTDARWSEFSMRVPVEPERDADCVLSQAAIDLRAYAATLEQQAEWPSDADVEKACAGFVEEHGGFRVDRKKMHAALQSVRPPAKPDAGMSDDPIGHPRAPDEQRDEIELFLRDAYAAGCHAAQARSMTTAIVYAHREAPKLHEKLASRHAQQAPDGWKLVPEKFSVSADVLNNAQAVFGGPGTGDGEDFIDCTAWVGAIEQDDGAEVSDKARKARFGFAEIEYCGTADFCRFQKALLDFYKTHQATIAQNAEDSKQLGELLAVIHGDGGHYLDKHGAKKSTEDAIAIYSSILIELDSKSEAAKRLKALEQALKEAHGLVDLSNLGVSKRADEIMQEYKEK